MMKCNPRVSNGNPGRKDRMEGLSPEFFTGAGRRVWEAFSTSHSKFTAV